MSRGNAHKHEPSRRFHKTPDHPSWSEGEVVSKKFGFKMKYKRYNMKRVTDDVTFEE